MDKVGTIGILFFGSLFVFLLGSIITCVFYQEEKAEFCTNFCEDNGMFYNGFIDSYEFFKIRKVSACKCCENIDKIEWDGYSALPVCNDIKEFEMVEK